MKIFELETEDRLNSLIDNSENVEKLNNSFAENRAQYRRFANSIVLPFDVLDECCRTYERNLLIDAYTYAEQLLKNFYYHMLEKDTASNISFQTFVNNKLKIDKFSPNARFRYMEQGIQNDLLPEFQFLISKNKPEIDKYDELIRSRHKYAHKGEYYFELSTIKEVISVEYYITTVFMMIVEKGINYRIDYQNRLKDILKQANKLVNLYKNEDNTPSALELKQTVREKEKFLYKDIKKFYKDYAGYFGKMNILETLITETENLLEINSSSHAKVRAQIELLYQISSKDLICLGK